MKKRKDLMLSGSITKLVLTMAVPVMLSNLMQTLFDIADTFWIGQYEMIHGAQGEMLSAIILITPMLWVLLTLGSSISTASISLISQYIGIDKDERAREVAGQAISLSLICGLIIGILGFVFSNEIVALLGAKGNVLIYGSKYLKILMLGLPTVFLFFSYNSIKQAQGDTTMPMVFSFLSIGLNMILDPLLMIVFNMGIQGAAIATVFSRGLFVIFAIISLFKKSKRHMKLQLSDLKLDKYTLYLFAKIGLPASISKLIASFGFVMMNKFVLSYGVDTLTAFGIGSQITGLILMPASGIGSAISAIVGTNLGAGQIKRARSTVKVSFLMASGILLFGGLFIYINADKLVSLFNNNPNVIAQCSEFLKLTILAIPLMAGFTVLKNTFIGSGHTHLTLIISVGRLWGFRIPLILFFTHFTSIGPRSVWYSMILSNLFICIVGYFIFRSSLWEKKVIKEAKVKVA